MINNVKNLIGDYAPQNIDLLQVEQGILNSGGESNEDLFLRCIQLIELNKDSQKEKITILDIGCGNGSFGKVCRKKGKKFVIDGLDLNVPEKRELIEQGYYTNIFEQDAVNYHFQKEYDFIVSNQFFEHLTPPDATELLRKLSLRYKNIIISVPVAFHTFAYIQDYLISSSKLNTDMKEDVYKMLVASVHKTYFTVKYMEMFGFKRVSPVIYISNFFVKEKQKSIKVSRNGFFKVLEQEIVSSKLREFYLKRKIIYPRPSIRYWYEFQLYSSYLLEPYSYKIFRKLIYILLFIPRKLFRIYEYHQNYYRKIIC